MPNSSTGFWLRTSSASDPWVSCSPAASGSAASKAACRTGPSQWKNRRCTSTTARPLWWSPGARNQLPGARQLRPLPGHDHSGAACGPLAARQRPHRPASGPTGPTALMTCTPTMPQARLSTTRSPTWAGMADRRPAFYKAGLLERLVPRQPPFPQRGLPRRRACGFAVAWATSDCTSSAARSGSWRRARPDLETG
jgi:hypothetical protein